MGKFDPIKMIELVKVEESEQELVLTFQENKSIKVTIVDGKLISQVIEG